MFDRVLNTSLLFINSLFEKCDKAKLSIIYIYIYIYILTNYLVGNYMFKVNNKNARTSCEICSELTIETPKRSYWRCSGVFIDNFEHISHLVLRSSVSVVNF